MEQPFLTATTALLNLILLRGEKPMMTALRAALALLLALAIAGLNFASAQTPSAPGAKAYFINLKDGQEVTGPFLVQFGLSGMGVAPAGVEKPNTGHHHLLIDSTLSDDECEC
jgi:Domain of unknown function (DUF4399)